jgi:ADP-ribosylglycohydrolase
MADNGRSFREVANAIEDKWHIEYPAPNNAVSNGGLAAASIFYGEGDFLKSLNNAYTAADFTDADCNGAVAGSVIAAMHGSKVLPAHLVKPLNDRIVGDKLGPWN